jgi:AcrR family transcriptional regulator
MTISAKPRAGDVTPDTSLRAAQKELTRHRIREAAKRVFHTAGFAATTIEQITMASHVSRATFYLHFKDKDEVARDIVEDYAGRAVAGIRQIPGPRPTQPQVRDWLDGVVQFFISELISLDLLYQVGRRGPGSPDYVRDLSVHVLGAFAERIPAFRLATQAGDHQLEARARTEMLVRQLSWACEFAARGGPTKSNLTALDVTAEAFVDVMNRLARLASGKSSGSRRA